ncbi:MAG: NAD(+) synthase [bacterium]|nr:NAD(+) synthase [bacterium]
MKNTYGFVRVAAGVPRVRVADPEFNANEAIALARAADVAGAHLLVLPECALTGYTGNDLFQQRALLDAVCAALRRVCEQTADCNLLVIVGLPLASENQLFNCAAMLCHGEILGVVPKTFIPGYKEYYEQRWFTSAADALADTIVLNGSPVPFGADLLFRAEGNASFTVGVELCEDLWSPIPPSSMQALAGATILCNLSASNELVGKAEYRAQLVRQQSARCIAGYVYASAGVGESTTDVVFSGHAMIAENGIILAENPRFERDPVLLITDLDLGRLLHDRRTTTSFSTAAAEHAPSCRTIDFTLEQPRWHTPLRRPIPTHPFVPADSAERTQRCKEIFSIQTAALAKRLEHCQIQRVVLGVSGGLDSTLALLVAVHTFDLLRYARSGIYALSMPGFGTSERTRDNVRSLCKTLGVTLEELDIRPLCAQIFSDLKHSPEHHDVTYENVQARARTLLLLNRANQLGALQLGTGDLSELALGWCTYGGDHLAMYNINCGVPKTLVRYLVAWVADTHCDPQARQALTDILATPISPELLPPTPDGTIAQKTEEMIGPYELHDFFLYHTVRCGAPPRVIYLLATQAFQHQYPPSAILRWLRVFYTRFFANQFKRSCVPDGPKVGSVSLSPRGDWRMPSDASPATWLAELDELQRHS